MEPAGLYILLVSIHSDSDGQLVQKAAATGFVLGLMVTTNDQK